MYIQHHLVALSLSAGIVGTHMIPPLTRGKQPCVCRNAQKCLSFLHSPDDPPVRLTSLPPSGNARINCLISNILLHAYLISVRNSPQSFSGKALAKMKGLEWLHLENNNLGPNGAKALAPALGKMEGLEILWFGNNKLAPDGATTSPAFAKMTGLNAKICKRTH